MLSTWTAMNGVASCLPEQQQRSNMQEPSIKRAFPRQNSPSNVPAPSQFRTRRFRSWTLSLNTRGSVITSPSPTGEERRREAEYVCEKFVACGVCRRAAGKAWTHARHERMRLLRKERRGPRKRDRPTRHRGRAPPPGNCPDELHWPCCAVLSPAKSCTMLKLECKRFLPCFGNELEESFNASRLRPIARSFNAQ